MKDKKLNKKKNQKMLYEPPKMEAVRISNSYKLSLTPAGSPGSSSSSPG